MKHYIEINNLSFGNKGDHLMVEAVLSTLSKRIGSLEYCVPLGLADASTRQRHGFQQTLRMSPGIDKSVYLRTSDWRRRSRLGRACLSVLALKNFFILKSIMPIPLLNRRGLISPRQVKAVIDIAGFSFSDFWGARKPKVLAEYYKECKKQGQIVVLMPKTYGPFSDSSLIASTRAIVNTVDLVFCRDQRSYEWLAEIGATRSHVHVAPDYTGAVPGALPAYADRYTDRAVIIPNYRMIDKTDKQVADTYPSFLASTFRYLDKRGKKPFVLLHDKFIDEPLLISLQEQIEQPLDVVIEEDPFFIKGIIGQCSSVVSSRLHGIINGLSQCVPTIGTGWAHKYPEIFRDYGCPEMLITDIRDKEDVETKLELLCNQQYMAGIQQRLQSANIRLLSLNKAMWDLIEQTINGEKMALIRSGGRFSYAA
jgi:polysaccharide pyruvyl transferase WcaK-like protein